MIGTLYIIGNNFKKHIFRNIIAIIFVALCMMMMNISLSRFMHEKYTYNLIKDTGLEGHFYISPISKSYSDRFQQMNFAVKKVEEMKQNGEIENYSCISSADVPVDNNRAFCVFCGTDLLNQIKYPLSNGMWFDEYDSSGGKPAPVIISYDLYQKYNILDELDIMGLRCVVIGVMERNNLILKSGAGGNGIALDNVFKKAENTIIVCGGNPYGMFDNIVVKAPSLDNQNFTTLKNIVDVVSFDELYKRNTEANSELIEMQTTTFLLMLLLSIIAVSSNNIISVITNKKKYSVYFMCGMEWRTAAAISIAEAVIKLVVPAIIGYIMFMQFCERNSYFSLRVNEINILITTFLLIVIFFLTSLRPLFEIKHTSPVKIISEV